MSSSPLIWLTRPQADSESFAAELGAQGVKTLIAPVMHIEPYTPRVIHIDAANAILLTSRHAKHTLSILPPEAKALPIFCVGAATAKLAQAAGFTQVIYGSNDVLSLLPRIMERLSRGSHLLYLAAEETRIDVGLLLRPFSINVEKVTTYIAHAETKLPDSLLTAIREKKITGASFFSPRSAQIAVELLKKHDLLSAAQNWDLYCLSLAVAEAAAPLGGRSLHACAIPSYAAMRDLIVSRTLEVL